MSADDNNGEGNQPYIEQMPLITEGHFLVWHIILLEQDIPL
jgi:hypothetical protein